MRLEVDTGRYHAAVDVCYDANHELTDAVGRMADVLHGCASMAGDDSGGQAWAASYDTAASDLVRAGADLGGSLGAVANLLNAALVNHEGADFGARIGGPGGGRADTGDTDPDHGTVRLHPSALPSAAGGSGGEPTGWHWIAAHLEGLVWPDADTGALRRAGAAWQQGAGVLTSVGWMVDAARLDIERQASPEVAPATRVCTELTRHCADLADAYDAIGSACTDYAAQVDEHHQEVLSVLRELLAWTVVDQVTGAVLSFFTAGASEVAAQLVQSGLMAKYAARVISVLRRLVELARAAAEVIAGAVARVGEVLATAKRLFDARVLRAFESAAERAARESRAATARFLERSELGSGHTIRDHVGKLDEQLAQRLASRPRLPGASSYTDAATAEHAIESLMSARHRSIAAWLAGSDRALIVNGDVGTVVGRVLRSGAAKAVDSTRIRMMFIRDPSAPSGYIMLTSYPI